MNHCTPEHDPRTAGFPNGRAAPVHDRSRLWSAGSAARRKSARRCRPGICGLVILLAASNLAAADSNSVPPTNAPALKPEPPPTTSREFFNAGTRKLREGQLREAEAFLQTALARQDEPVQPPALYNLGHVRFNQGAEELKKSQAARPTAERARAAAQQATRALRQAKDALASDDVMQMVDAYLQGRGARRELKAATQAVRRTLELHGAALRKWQRARGDFQGAVELNPADTNAQHNVEIVGRAIARLVDSLQQLQQAMQGLGQPQQELGEALKQLKGRIPAPLMPPGAPGDGEEDENGEGDGEEDSEGREPRPGQAEKPSRDGQELSLSPEAAGWLLEAFRLDGDRRLPMGPGGTGQPKDRARRNW